MELKTYGECNGPISGREPNIREKIDAIYELASECEKHKISIEMALSGPKVSGKCCTEPQFETVEQKLESLHEVIYNLREDLRCINNKL